MRRYLALALPMMILAACGGQETSATIAPTLDPTLAPLPMDATSTMDSAILPLDATATIDTTLIPLFGTPEFETLILTPTESALLSLDSTPVEVAQLPTETLLTPDATPTLGLQPGANFDATPTPEAMVAQTAEGVEAQVGLGPDTISADAWGSAQPITDGEPYSTTDIVGNTLTLFVPTSWTAYQDTETLVIANYDYAANPTASLSDTQIAASVFVIPNDLASLSVAEGFEASCPLILANFIETTSNMPDAQWGQILLTRTADRDGAMVNGNNGDDDALIACVQIETGYGMVIASSEQGQMVAAVPFITNLARTLEYEA